MVHLHNRVLLGHKKEGNLSLCGSMDGPGEHYAKRKKPVRERQIPYDFTHMESSKQNKLTGKREIDSHK